MSELQGQIKGGFFYLHESGDLIWKQSKPTLGPDVRAVWPFDARDRAAAWIMLSEALAMGAMRSRVGELAEQWGIDDEDGKVFLEVAKLRQRRDGETVRVTFADFESLEKSPAGFGPTILDALADLRLSVQRMAPKEAVPIRLAMNTSREQERRMRQMARRAQKEGPKL